MNLLDYAVLYVVFSHYAFALGKYRITFTRLIFTTVKMPKRFWMIVAGLLIGVHSQAQYWLGVSSSNYAGTNSLFLNPAHAADSRYKLYINLVGNDIYLMNNYIRWGAPYSIFGIMTNTVPKKHRSARGAIIWQEEYYRERLNGERKHLHTGGDLRGPSLLYSFKNNRFAIGLTSRGRYALSLTDVEQTTARVIRFGTDNKELQDQDFRSQQAKLNTNGFLEMGATFGAVVADYDEHFLKVGATVKRLVGVYNVHADLRNADYRIWVESLNRDREFIVVQNLDATYGYTTGDAFDNIRLNPKFLFGKASAGGSWGGDLGVVYEYRPDFDAYTRKVPKLGKEPDPNKNKYKYRISAAITDIGRLNYKNINYIREIDVQKARDEFSYTEFDRANTTSKALAALNKSLLVNPDNFPRTFKVGLPLAANVSFDYHHSGPWYVNATWIQGLRGGNYMDIKPLSVLAVTPRFETRWVEFSTPLSLYDNYRALSIGLAARLGPLIVGTDHMTGLFGLGNPQGANLYFGLYVPFIHRKPSESIKCWFPPYEKTMKRKR